MSKTFGNLWDIQYWLWTSVLRDSSRTPRGLYDMIGNVSEWCGDGFRGYDDVWKVDPVGPLDAGANRVICGGSWSNLAGSCRSAYPIRNLPDDRNLGFRCARVQE